MQTTVSRTSGFLRASDRAALLVVFAAFAALFISAPGFAAQPRWIEDEILVGMRRGAVPASVEKIAYGAGGGVIRNISEIGVLHLRVPPQALEAVMSALNHRSDVVFVEQNRALPPSVVPNDPEYAAQWHLPHIEAPAAWDHTTGANVVIAILDSGVDASHPDLGPKIVEGYDTTGGRSTEDVTGHGTAVAGSATAFGNNGVGIASPAWHSMLMPLRVTGSDGWATDADLAEGLVWAVNHGARVLNLSFGYVADSATIVSAARYAFQNGGLVVAASGNCGCREATRDTRYILNVSATDTADGVSSFSSTGRFVDLAAPGVGIYTTIRGGGYRYASGTSHASPLVAGVAALLFSLDPSLSPGDVEDILERTAEDLGSPGWDPEYGYGRVNARRAVLAVAGGSPPPPPESEPTDTTAPEVWIDAPSDGALVSGVVGVLATANDDTGVAGVDFYVDGVLAGSASATPYSFSWDTTRVPDGPHSLEVLALDEAGNQGHSGVVQVVVQNAAAVPDTSPPVVVILAPEDGSRVRGRLRVKVRASDDRSVESVDLLLDGRRVDSKVCGEPSCTLRFSRKIANGRHQIAVSARDQAGNETTSPALEVIR